MPALSLQKHLSPQHMGTLAFHLQKACTENRLRREYHRRHIALLLCRGLSVPEVARLMGDSVSTVKYVLYRLRDQGLAFKYAPRPGRPSRLGPDHLPKLKAALNKLPRDFGLKHKRWTGQALAALADQLFELKLGTRQAQRLLRELKPKTKKTVPVVLPEDIPGLEQVILEAQEKTPDSLNNLQIQSPPVGFSSAPEVIPGASSVIPAPAQVISTPSYSREFFHVGRNDPCPCRSGKKFKRCCIKRSR